MKFYQPMTVAYDLSPDSYRLAVSYRSMIEMYPHNVALARLHDEESVRSFFGRPPRSALTLLVCHGWAETELDAVINLEIQRPVNRVEYEGTQFELTPARLVEMVGEGEGVFMTSACWSGKAAFARAILAAGFDCYIAPEKTADSFSAYQFASAFVGTLLHEERDWGAYPVTTRQAFERAKLVDDFWDGAAGFLLFES